MNFLSTLTLPKLPLVTKANFVFSSMPLIILSSEEFFNDGIHSDLFLALGTFIDTELDVRLERLH